MKTLQKILKISAKYAFKKLRENSPYFCKALNEEIFVTRVFWNHINFSKERTLKESLQRLSIFPIIETIITKGIVFEERKNFKELIYTENSVEFSLIIVKNSYRWTALSCFIPYNKKTLCLSPLGPQE